MVISSTSPSIKILDSILDEYPVKMTDLSADSLSTPSAANIPLPSDSLLNVRVFNGGDSNNGFGVNSAIIYGERDAVLIDAQLVLSSGHRLVAEILETGRTLQTIYITHMHPDHFMALSVVTDAFPDAQVVSLPQVAAMVNKAYPFKIGYWTKEIFHENGTKSAVEIKELKHPVIELEGHRLEIIGPTRGDSDLATAVWVPDIKTFIAGDIVFSNAHVWIADSKTPEMREDWLKELEHVESLSPCFVVPGHAPSASYVSPESILFTQDYIKTFIDVMYRVDSGQQLIEEMTRRYPGLATLVCLHFSALIMKDHYKWPGEWPPSLRAIKPR